MKRKDFLKYFATKYPKEYLSDYQSLSLDIDLTNEDDKGTFCLLYLNSIFDDIFTAMKADSFKICKNIVKIDFDWDYAEEYSDNDIWRYSSRINLNQLYDEIILNHKIYGNTTTLYRLEDLNNKGLYDGKGWAAMEKSTGFHPGPEEDLSFAKIFDFRNYYIENEYKREWNFSFKDLEQLKSWVGDKATLEKLIDLNFVIKEISISENCVIAGTHQAIYKKHGIIHEQSLELSSVSNLFEVPSKLTTKKMPSL